jgi:hypothetical protein
MFTFASYFGICNMTEPFLLLANGIGDSCILFIYLYADVSLRLYGSVCYELIHLGCVYATSRQLCLKRIRPGRLGL